MAQILVPSHIHSSSPDFVARLEGQRIFLDVGTLLRAVLFKESHSNRIFEHIELTRSGIAVVSPHVRDKALNVLVKHYPALRETFIAGYLALIERKILEVVPNGDISTLPVEAATYDPADDSVVLASAVFAHCTYLATLDEKFSRIAANCITVLPPCEPEYSTMRLAQTQLPPIYSGSEQGTLLMLVRPQEGSTNYTKQGGRRYVFATDEGVACWLSEESWHYEIGLVDRQEPVFRFDTPARGGEEVFVGLSYELLGEGAIFAVLATPAGNAEIEQLPRKIFPRTIGKNWSILGRGDHATFSGYWRGVLSSGQHVARSGLKYAVAHKSFFLPLDAQRFKLKDAVIEPSLVLVPERTLGHR